MKEMDFETILRGSDSTGVNTDCAFHMIVADVYDDTLKDQIPILIAEVTDRSGLSRRRTKQVRTTNPFSTSSM